MGPERPSSVEILIQLRELKVIVVLQVRFSEKFHESIELCAYADRLQKVPQNWQAGPDPLVPTARGSRSRLLPAPAISLLVRRTFRTASTSCILLFDVGRCTTSSALNDKSL